MVWSQSEKKRIFAQTTEETMYTVSLWMLYTLLFGDLYPLNFFSELRKMDESPRQKGSPFSQKKTSRISPDISRTIPETFLTNMRLCSTQFLFCVWFFFFSLFHEFRNRFTSLLSLLNRRIIAFHDCVLWFSRYFVLHSVCVSSFIPLHFCFCLVFASFFSPSVVRLLLSKTMRTNSNQSLVNGGVVSHYIWWYDCVLELESV